jgi:hypothetical protein
MGVHYQVQTKIRFKIIEIILKRIPKRTRFPQLTVQAENVSTSDPVIRVKTEDRFTCVCHLEKSEIRP